MGSKIYDWIVVGAGVSGSYLAHVLSAQGAQVALVEKSRGFGGRLCYRRTDESHFLHGAQFFTIKSPIFRSAIQSFLDAKEVVPWPGKIAYIRENGQIEDANQTPRYSMYPKTDLFCRYWARDADVFLRTKVLRVEKRECWNLYTEEGLFAQANNLVISAPLPQTKDLIPSALQQEHNLELDSDWRKAATLMMSFREDASILPNPYSAAFVKSKEIDFVSSQESRMGDTGRRHWAFVLSDEFSDKHWKLDIESVKAKVHQSLVHLGLGGLNEESYQSLHFWRYASPIATKNIPQWYPELKLGLVGEVFQGGRVEGAFLSSVALLNELEQAKNRI